MKTAILFAGVSLTSSLVGWQEQLEWGVRMLALLLGVISALISIIAGLRSLLGKKPQPAKVPVD